MGGIYLLGVALDTMGRMATMMMQRLKDTDNFVGGGPIF